MIHNIILAGCVAAAVMVLLFVLWTMIGNKMDSNGGIFAGHALAHPFDQFFGVQRRPADVIFRTSSQRGLPGGWSRIHRTIRARSNIRIAAR